MTWWQVLRYNVTCNILGGCIKGLGFPTHQRLPTHRLLGEACRVHARVSTRVLVRLVKRPQHLRLADGGHEQRVVDEVLAVMLGC